MAGAAVVGVSTWVLVTSWDAIFSGHPSYPIFYGSSLGIATASIYRSTRRSSVRRLLLSGLASLALVLLAAASLWLRPFPAHDTALRALENPERYEVATTPTAIMLEPIVTDSRVALIFQPGARVDARAYVSILADIAVAGYPVVIVKQPLGIAFLALGSIPGVVEEDPEIRWVAAGHSLGGVVASGAANEGVAGLVLWASYPAGDISGRSGPEATSIYGTADAITTVSDIRESEDRLPAQAELVAVEGAIHSFFGDYGLQPGDGTPTIDRSAAQAMIVAATLDLLERVENGLEKSTALP